MPLPASTSQLKGHTGAEYRASDLLKHDGIYGWGFSQSSSV